MNSTASLLTAAVSISAGKWKRNEGRLTSDDILQGITDAEEVSAFPKRVIADWAAEVVGKLSNTEPSGPSSAPKALVRSAQRKRTPVFELNPSQPLDKTLSYLESYVIRPALQATAAPSPTSSSDTVFDGAHPNVKAFPNAAKLTFTDGHFVMSSPPTSAEDVTALLSSLNPDDFEDGIPLDTSAINSLLKLRSDVNSALKRLRQEEEAASTAITGVRESCWADAIRAVKYCANSCEEVTEWFNNECGNVREFVVCDDGAAGKTVEDMKAALLSTAQGGKKGAEYTGNARARKEAANVAKRDAATALLTGHLSAITNATSRWAKVITDCGREAVEEVATVSDALSGLLDELGDAASPAMKTFADAKEALASSLSKHVELIAGKCAALIDITAKNTQRILGQWREASGLDAPDAPDAASSTSIDSPAMITVNIEGIVAWLDSKELLKALKKCEKLSGADEAVTALTIAKDGLRDLSMAVAEGYVTAARNAEVVASASILSGLDSSAKTALDSVSSEFDLYHKAFQQVLRIADKVVSSIILDRLSKLIPPEPVAPVSIAAAAVDDTPSPTPQPPPVPIKSPKKKVQKKKAVGTGSGAGEATIVEVEATDSPIPESPAVPIDDSEAVIKQLLSAMTDKDKELDIAKATIASLSADLATTRQQLQAALAQISKLTQDLADARLIASAHDRSAVSTPSAVKQVVVATVKEKPPTPSRVSVEEEIEPFKTPPRHRNRQKGTSSRVVTPGDEGVGYVKPTAPQDVSFGYAAPGEPPVIEVVLSTERPRTTGRGSGQRARGGPVSGSEALYVPPGRRNQRAPSEGDDM